MFKETVKEVCNIYINASSLADEDVNIFCTDEKMGVQALEHKNVKIPTEPGQVERIDPEYIRHGTSGLIASRDVLSGEIVAPLIQPTRTEEDFAKHIQAVLEKSSGICCFVVDNLNTHKSETLVKLVANKCNIDIDTLGVKGKEGVLENMETRAAFLSDKSHCVYFVYTPKHCSWLNQIECWFSILTRRLLNKRASFKSVAEMESKIQSFIDYYNKFLKKPFQWNYSGKLLKI